MIRPSNQTGTLVTMLGLLLLICWPACTDPTPTTENTTETTQTQETSPEPTTETLPDRPSIQDIIVGDLVPDITLRDYPMDSQLTLNHIQVKGTHNSYHIDPGQGVDEWRYTHKPLDVQFGSQGVRQIELDIYWNEERKVMLVQHIPVLDDKTTCDTLPICLQVIKKWSDAHPQHLPIFIFIEPKGIAKIPTKQAFDTVEKDALAAFPSSRIIKPDDVRKQHPDLRTAVAADGWPTLGTSRGKVCFVLLTRGEYRTAYTDNDTSLKGKLMFVLAGLDKPYGAITAIDDPIKNEQEIIDTVKKGILVRTRADAAREQAKTNDKTRLQAALRSGAHMLSTDYPAKVEGIDYVVDIPGGTPARCNPITAPKSCTSQALE